MLICLPMNCVPVSRCGLERVNARAPCLSAITVFVVGSHLDGRPRPEPPSSGSGAVTAVVFFGEETARVGRGGDGLVFGVGGHVVAARGRGGGVKFGCYSEGFKGYCVLSLASTRLLFFDASPLRLLLFPFLLFFLTLFCC